VVEAVGAEAGAAVVGAAVVVQVAGAVVVEVRAVRRRRGPAPGTVSAVVVVEVVAAAVEATHPLRPAPRRKADPWT
jgi:hypothetical protein